MTEAVESAESGLQIKAGKALERTKQRSLKALDPAILQDMDISLTAVLGQGKATVRQLLELTNGSVVTLDTPLDGRVELKLNERLIAVGELVAVEDKYGVRITQIVAEKG